MMSNEFLDYVPYWVMYICYILLFFLSVEGGKNQKKNALDGAICKIYRR